MPRIEEKPYQTPAYKRSRSAYVAECALEYMVTLLAADAFLAKLLSHIGLSDATVGLISSFVMLAFLFQASAIFLSHKIKEVKATVTTIHIAGQSLFAVLFLTPFIPLSAMGKAWVAGVCLMGAYAVNYTVASLLFRWANSFVSPAARGEYSAKKEMVSLVTGMLMTLLAGFVLDRYEAAGHIERGFLFVAGLMLVLTAFDLLCLLLIRKEKHKNTASSPEAPSVKGTVKALFSNRSFVNITIMTALWEMARYTSFGFLGTFKTKDLMLSVTCIQVINLLANAARLGVSIPFGRYADRHSYAKGLKLALMVTGISFAVNVFTTQRTWWCVAIHTVLFHASLAGIQQNTFNILYSYVEPQHFVAASAIKNSISSLFGFGASVMAGWLLSYVQENGNRFLGISLYGQQLLSLLSFVLTAITVLFIHAVIEKQPPTHV